MIDAELWRTQCQGAVGIRTVDDIVTVIGFQVVAHGGNADGAIAELESPTRLRRVVKKCRCMMSSRGKGGRYTDVSGGDVKQLTAR